LRVRADLHIHSVVSDGVLHPLDVVRVSRRRGLSVISITDHNTFAGSVIASRYWGRELPLIIYGAEVKSVIGDILVLCPHPIKVFSDVMKLIDVSNDNNCILIPAHPYDLLRYGVGPYVRLRYWDAIEVFNSSSDPISNTVAYLITRKLGKPLLANSDAHVAEMIGSSHNVIYVSELSIENVLESIKKGFTEYVSRYSLRGYIWKISWSLKRLATYGIQPALPRVRYFELIE